MKILYWTELFWPHIGGIEVLSTQLISALQERGHEFAVVTSHSHLELPDEDIHKGIPIYRFHFLTALNNNNLRQLITARQQVAKLKQSFKPDLVHLHLSGPSAYFHLQTETAHPAPTLITIHSLPKHRSKQHGLLTRTLQNASWINTVSTTTLDELYQLVPEIKSRSSVIYNGLKMPKLEPTSLPFEPPQLLCIGRFLAWKGFDLAINAFATLQERFPQTRLVIAGDGPTKPDLEQLVAKLNLNHKITFTGWIIPEKIAALINTTTIVIIPSRTGEMLPVVALQAAQMARPVIATRVAGLPEFVKHQQTGLLVERDNSTALANAIAFLLEHPEMATRIGQVARQTTQKVFSLKQCVDAYNKLYKSFYV